LIWQAASQEGLAVATFLKSQRDLDPDKGDAKKLKHLKESVFALIEKLEIFSVSYEKAAVPLLSFRIRRQVFALLNAIGEPVKAINALNATWTLLEALGRADFKIAMSALMHAQDVTFDLPLQRKQSIASLYLSRHLGEENGRRALALGILESSCYPSFGIKPNPRTNWHRISQYVTRTGMRLAADLEDKHLHLLCILLHLKFSCILLNEQQQRTLFAEAQNLSKLMTPLESRDICASALPAFVCSTELVSREYTVQTKKNSKFFQDLPSLRDDSQEKAHVIIANEQFSVCIDLHNPHLFEVLLQNMYILGYVNDDMAIESEACTLELAPRQRQKISINCIPKQAGVLVLDSIQFTFCGIEFGERTFELPPQTVLAEQPLLKLSSTNVDNRAIQLLEGERFLLALVYSNTGSMAINHLDLNVKCNWQPHERTLNSLLYRKWECPYRVLTCLNMLTLSTGSDLVVEIEVVGILGLSSLDISMIYCENSNGLEKCVSVNVLTTIEPTFTLSCCSLQENAQGSCELSLMFANLTEYALKIEGSSIAPKESRRLIFPLNQIEPPGRNPLQTLHLSDEKLALLNKHKAHVDLDVFYYSHMILNHLDTLYEYLNKQGKFDFEELQLSRTHLSILFPCPMSVFEMHIEGTRLKLNIETNSTLLLRLFAHECKSFRSLLPDQAYIELFDSFNQEFTLGLGTSGIVACVTDAKTRKMWWKST
jgi:hypothetical protein